jgi:plastocyanin
MNGTHIGRGSAISLLGALLAVLASAALLVAIVGGGSAGASGPQAAKRATVKIKSFKYHPSPITVKKGTRVAFTNKDHAKHTATHKGIFNTGKIKHGKTVVIRFKHKGTFKYHCKIHPFMHGKIKVR